jgi:hypothetical protein
LKNREFLIRTEGSDLAGNVWSIRFNARSTRLAHAWTLSGAVLEALGDQLRRVVGASAGLESRRRRGARLGLFARVEPGLVGSGGIPAPTRKAKP